MPKYRSFMYAINENNEAIIIKDTSTATKLEIPSKINGLAVTEIDGYAFYDHTQLKNIIIPDGIIFIGHCAFVDCTSLKNIAIPKSVKQICYSAFQGCDSLENINVAANNNYSSINGVLFDKSRTLIIRYPEGKMENSYSIPDKVSRVGTYAFYGCKSLTSITIPNSVLSIENYAFCDCASLTEITIPDSVTNIERRAFVNCPDDLTIRCNPGSYVEQWAKQRKITTKPIMSDLDKLLQDTKINKSSIVYSVESEER